jgi:hypothetical protein
MCPSASIRLSIEGAQTDAERAHGHHRFTELLDLNDE